MKRLANSGIDTGRGYKGPVSIEQAAEAYELYGGDIFQIVEHFKPTFYEYDKQRIRSKKNWTRIYELIDDLGYLTKSELPITSAIAAAAWYKYGTTMKAGEALGVSHTHIRRKAGEARYINRSKGAKKNG